MRAQAENLVAFIASGDSATVRARLLGVEQHIATTEVQLAGGTSPPCCLPAHTWLLAKLRAVGNAESASRTAAGSTVPAVGCPASFR